MNERTRSTIELAQATERLRQETETFNQKKQQDHQWFLLRRTMGWIAAVLLPLIMAICSWIIFQHDSFTATTVNLAAAALFTDALGLVVALWRSVVGTRGPQTLAPVTGVPEAQTADAE